MSNGRGKWVSHWDGIIETFEPVPDAKTEAVKAVIDVGVTAFETHKEKLLAIIREAYERGTKSEPFDEDGTWRRLTFLAGYYFWRERLKQEVLPAADRSKRLLKIATALGDARRLVDEAQHDELVDYLYSAWCDQNIRYDVDPVRPLVLVRFQDEFDKVVAALSALEAAACKARDDSVPQSGRPRGSILSPDIIDALADRYQQSAGLKLDKLTDEYFVEFVREFATAVGRGRKVDPLEVIKYALRLKRKKDHRVRE